MLAPEESFEAMASGFAARWKVEEITAQQLLVRSPSAPTLLLDVREPAEQSVSRLPGSIQIRPTDSLAMVPAVREFIARHAQQADALIVTYCAGGYRSARSINKAAATLQLPMRNLHGGIVAYANSGGRLVQPDGSPTNLVHGYNELWVRFVEPPAIGVLEPPIEKNR